MSYTYALLDVSPATFAEIKQKLEAAGYQHAFHDSASDGLVIDMHGIALRREAVLTDAEANAEKRHDLYGDRS